MIELKFLGTAGARFVVAKQLRYSAGTFIKTDKTNLILDPGPGTLLRLAKSKPKIDIDLIDGIILSHIHLDHSTDANVIIDSITKGGLIKKGFLLTAKEAVEGENRIILPFLLPFLEEVAFFRHEVPVKIRDLEITPFLHKHSAETYGFKIKINDFAISFIIDTEFFPDLINYYSGSNVLVINVVRYKKKEDLQHLSLDDAEKLILSIKPEKAILTHFGMTMIYAKPYEIAQKLSIITKRDVIAAVDGLSLKFIC